MAARLAIPVVFVLLMLGLWGMASQEPQQPEPIVPPVAFEELLRGSAAADARVEGEVGNTIPAVHRAPSTAPASSPVVGVAAGGAAATTTPSELEPPVAAPPTVEEPFELWLAESPWPRDLWPEVTEIAHCESRHLPHVIGDGGLAYGLLQIREDYWPRLVRSFDLLDPRDNLAAAWIVYLEAGRSFAPWSCWEG